MTVRPSENDKVPNILPEPGTCPKCTTALRTCKINFEQSINICPNLKCSFLLLKKDIFNLKSTSTSTSEVSSLPPSDSHPADVKSSDVVNDLFDIDEFLANDGNMEMLQSDFTDIFDISFLNNLLQGNNV